MLQLLIMKKDRADNTVFYYAVDGRHPAKCRYAEGHRV